MKKLMIIAMLTAAISVSAQSGQDRAMLQQIAFLKKYGSYVKKGYSIARDGLKFISNAKDGELNLHTLFFNSLENVSPFVASYPRVAATIELAARITQIKAELSGRLTDDLFHGNEKDYLLRILERLLSGCTDDLQQLQSVVSGNSLTANDAERIARIDAIHGSMLERYSFAQKFRDDCMALAAARQHELLDIHKSRELHNLNPSP